MGALISLFISLGLILVFLEFFMPSGLLGSIAALLFFSGITVFWFYTTSPTWTVLLLFLVLGLIWIDCRFALSRVRKSILLKEDHQGFQASTYDPDLIGREGVALTDLKPSGHIVIEDEKFQALSETGYISKGAPVTVIRGRGAYLIVKRSGYG